MITDYIPVSGVLLGGVCRGWGGGGYMAWNGTNDIVGKCPFNIQIICNNL